MKFSGNGYEYYLGRVNVAGGHEDAPALVKPCNEIFDMVNSGELAKAEQSADDRDVAGILDNFTFCDNDNYSLNGFRGTHVVASLNDTTSPVVVWMTPATREDTVMETAYRQASLAVTPVDGSVAASAPKGGLLMNATHHLLAPIEAGSSNDERLQYVKEGRQVESLIARLAAFALEHALVPFRTRLRPVAAGACYLYMHQKSGSSAVPHSIRDQSDLDNYLGVAANEEKRQHVCVVYAGDASLVKGMALLSALGRRGGPMYQSTCALLRQFDSDIKVLLVGNKALRNTWPNVQANDLWEAISDAEYILTHWNGATRGMFDHYISLFANNLPVLNLPAMRESGDQDFIFNQNRGQLGARPDGQRPGLDDLLDNAIRDNLGLTAAALDLPAQTVRGLFSTVFRATELTGALAGAEAPGNAFRVGRGVVNTLLNGLENVADDALYGVNIRRWTYANGPRLDQLTQHEHVTYHDLLPVMPILSGMRGFRMFTYLAENVAEPQAQLAAGLAVVDPAFIGLVDLQLVVANVAGDAQAQPPVIGQSWYEVVGRDAPLGVNTMVIDYSYMSAENAANNMPETFRLATPFNPAPLELVNNARMTDLGWAELLRDAWHPLRAAGMDEMDRIIREPAHYPNLVGNATAPWHLMMNKVVILARCWLSRNVDNEFQVIEARQRAIGGANNQIHGPADTMVSYLGGMRRVKHLTVAAGLWVLGYLGSPEILKRDDYQICASLRTTDMLVDGLIKLRASTDAANMLMRVSPSCVEGVSNGWYQLGAATERLLTRRLKSAERSFDANILNQQLATYRMLAFGASDVKSLLAYETRTLPKFSVGDLVDLNALQMKYLSFSIPVLLKEITVYKACGVTYPSLQVNYKGQNLLNQMTWAGRYDMDDKDFVHDDHIMDTSSSELLMARIYSSGATKVAVMSWSSVTVGEALSIDTDEFRGSQDPDYGKPCLRWSFPFIAEPSVVGWTTARNGNLDNHTHDDWFDIDGTGQLATAVPDYYAMGLNLPDSPAVCDTIRTVPRNLMVFGQVNFYHNSSRMSSIAPIPHKKDMLTSYMTVGARKLLGKLTKIPDTDAQSMVVGGVEVKNTTVQGTTGIDLSGAKETVDLASIQAQIAALMAMLPQTAANDSNVAGNVAPGSSDFQ